MLKIFLFSLLVTVFSLSVNAQCMLRPVSLSDRCNEATLIVEGKLVSKASFWDAPHENIYTSNVIEVSKILKGSVSTSTIEIISEGGMVGYRFQEVTNSLELEGNDYGVFMLKPSQVGFPADFASGVTRYQAVAATQGFIHFEMDNKSAHDVFTVYNDVNDKVYKPIQLYTGQPVKVVKVPVVTSPDRTRGAVSVTGFSPGVVTAGTKTILTINGSGFGSSQGSNVAFFSHADYGGFQLIAPAQTDYISWKDNEIKVYVPHRGGTGIVGVQINGNKYYSSASLTVNYARINLYTTVDSYQSNFIGSSNSGYKWTYNSQFNTNTAAKAAFLRAFNSWRCATLVNWWIDTVSTTSVNKSANDGLCVISFDIGSDKLPTGVLGRCSTWGNSCSGTVWYVDELDILFSSGGTWNYSTSLPSSSETDFESVAVHELGHGQQLGHVIDQNDIMHYAIGDGQSKRVLNQYNIACGTAVITKSTSTTICSKPKMVAILSSKCKIGGGTSSPDVTAPIITTLSPANAATNVIVATNMVVTFNEPVNAGTIGNITIKSGASTFATIPITSGQVSVSGSTLTINPTSNLASNTNYYLIIDNGAIKDLAGNLFGGISTSTVWAFKTASGGTGIAEMEAMGKALNIFPNPSNGVFTLQFDATLDNASYEVFNLLGQQVNNGKIVSNTTAVNFLAPSGVYIVRVKNGDAMVERKLIVE